MSGSYAGSPAGCCGAALQLIADVAETDIESVALEQELLADLAIDSPKALRLLMDLEDRFEVEVSDEQAATLRTVGDIVAFVEQHAGELPARRPSVEATGPQ